MKPNRIATKIFTLIAAASCSVSALYAQMPAQPAVAPATGPAASITQAVIRFENNLLALAEAMPADKYNFAPTKDIFKPGSSADFATVRTFGQQLTHVSAEPFRLLAPFGVTPDPGVDPKTFDALTSKDNIVKALKESFNYQNTVIATITPANALTPVGPRNATLVSSLISILNDDGDHYGQLVEYLRMNGIIPPATANQPAGGINRPAAPATK